MGRRNGMKSPGAGTDLGATGLGTSGADHHQYPKGGHTRSYEIKRRSQSVYFKYDLCIALSNGISPYSPD